MWQRAHKQQFAAWRAVPVDHQPVDRHRAPGEPEDPDGKPMPSRRLQGHRIEQPADVRDGTGLVGPRRGARRIVASTVKRQRALSQLAYGCGARHDAPLRG